LAVTVTNCWWLKKHKDREEKDGKLSGGTAYHKDLQREKADLCEK